ncbi:hypothetical protein GCM10020218_077910 [Dactylosporangium vinaceum]
MVRQATAAKAVEQGGGEVRIRLADGEEITAAAAIGADGSSGITARQVGVEYGQVDLGLEVELPIDAARQEQWRGRLLIDWGPLPGSYAWVFPKGDLLTVGVIAARGEGSGPRRTSRVRRAARAAGHRARARLRPT